MPLDPERREGGVTIDGQFLVVRRFDVTVRVNLADAFHDLNDAERMELAELVTWGPVMREACRRLASMSQSWDGDDWETREQWLLDVQAVHTDEVASAKRQASEARGQHSALQDVVRGIGRRLLELLGDKLDERQRAAVIAAMHLDEKDVVPGEDPARRMAFKEACELLFGEARRLRGIGEERTANVVYATAMWLNGLVAAGKASTPDVFEQRAALARALQRILSLTGEQGMEANDAAFAEAEAAMAMVPPEVLGA